MTTPRIFTDANLIRARALESRPERAIRKLAKAHDEARAFGQWPVHLYPPIYSTPFLATRDNSGANAVGNTLVVVATVTVPEDMFAFVDYFAQKTTNFSAGVTDEIIEWQLRQGPDGIRPWERFTGLQSTYQNPIRWRCVSQIAPQVVITLMARVLPAAEGGIAGTVDVRASIAGWFIPA